MAEIPTTFSAPPRARTTRHIKRKPAANFWHAFNFADDSGRPLTDLVTLNFALTDCPPDAMTAQFMLLVERYYARWWRRLPARARPRTLGPCAYVWVAENASGQHCIHWVLNLPADRRPDFAKRLPGWVAKVAGIVQPGAIDILSVHNAAGLRKYLLKGCEPAYAAFCKIDFEDQGDIIGKRCGVSRSLQRTARERHNYRSRRFARRSYTGASASPSS